MREKFWSIIFIGFLVLIFLFNIITPDLAYSVTEKRKLNQFPQINFSNLLDASFGTDFDFYSSDQFIKRNEFRKIKYIVELNAFHKKDVNNLFVSQNHIFKYNSSYNEKQIIGFSNKINYIKETYFKNNNAYYGIILDKNYYLDDSSYLRFDYDNLLKTLYSNTKDITYINLIDSINLNSYYFTDPHLRQDQEFNLVSKLATVMNFKFNSNIYTNKEINDYYGTYYGQLPLLNHGEKIIYLDSNNDQIVVTSLENDFHQLYNLTKTDDLYDIFLSGAQAFMTIENKSLNNKKQLIVFRDSYGSSIIPLLADSYEKITLIDLRYINLSTALNYVNIADQDVLFLYSIGIVNGSNVLKTN